METLILAIVIAWAVRHAAGHAHDHWQGAKSANRKATRGQPARQRAASAVRHDTAYWAEQVRGGFPQVRHGLYMGWHSGRIAQLEGQEERAKAKADHADLRARTAAAVREQRRRQAEALDRIRAAAAEAGPEPEPGAEPAEAAAWPPPPEDGSGSTPVTPPVTTPTEGNAMSSGDTTYRQQMAELQAIRGDAEEEVNDVRRKRMMNRLDVLMSLGLDKQTCAEAAAIDDALREQEKAAQQTLDATDAAIGGLSKRHGGIQEAVDSAPVDKPAEPDFYTD